VGIKRRRRISWGRCRMSVVDLFAIIFLIATIVVTSIFSFKVHLIFLIFNIPLLWLLFWHGKEIVDNIIFAYHAILKMEEKK